ncbi:addiction module protein [Verrucomicrobiaceae bacterium N1E253]|uniref:Addiction module protein n=1 Tax=Oceaniferula marina TaxID=2748318 RepID=A0A851GIY6_9BACT|nr:addiction module protein [Oceaniferula marina]NWK55155.1 addiction module protein [Oceaniferula marina]
MSKALEIYHQVLDLPEDQRASLVADILDTLPASLSDEDEGLAEARRRSKQMDEDPNIGMTWDEIKVSLGR